LLYDGDNSPSTYDHSPSTYDHASIDHRFNKLQSEMRDMSTATDNKLNSFGHKLEVLGDKLSMEIKVLGTTMDARFEISDGKTQSKFDALRIELREREVRFWVRVVFTVSGLLCICYILPSNNAKLVAVAGLASGAAVLQFQNRAIQTPTIQTPAIQTPAVQTPAVQTPAVQAPAVGQK
jgi:hypothetical protein